MSIARMSFANSLTLLIGFAGLLGLLTQTANAASESHTLAPVDAEPAEQIAWAAEYLAGVKRGESNPFAADPVSLTANPGSVIRVHQAAAGANDGSSWTNAFTDLQAALAIATAGDEIWVAAGTYVPDPNGDPNAVFELVDQVNLYGGFAGTENLRSLRDPELNVTILSGDLLGDDQPNFVNREDNSYRIVRAKDLAPLTTLDGFTIRGGGIPDRLPEYLEDTGGNGLAVDGGGITVLNCTFEENQGHYNGIAISVVNAALRLEDCVIQNNQTTIASSWQLSGALTGKQAYLNVIRCQFDSNQSQDGGCISTHDTDVLVALSQFTNTRGVLHSGRSVYCSGGAVQFLGCAFEGYAADEPRTGMGVAIVTPGITPNTLLDLPTPAFLYQCEFRNNASSYGAAVAYHGWPSITIAGCDFENNRRSLNGGNAYTLNDEGGAVAIERSWWSNQRLENVTISDTTFINNDAPSSGALFVESDKIDITGSRFEGHLGTRIREPGAVKLNIQETCTITDTTFEQNVGKVGGAMQCYAYYAHLEDCRFSHNNVAGDHGGALLLASTVGSLVSNCRFIGNESIAPSGYGGGAVFSSGDVTFVNCLFSGNHATGCGSLMVCFDNAFFENCTFANLTPDVSAFCYGKENLLTIRNSVLWGGLTQLTSREDNLLALSDSIVQGGYTAGTNIIDADPNFVDPIGADGIPGTEDDDLRLTAGSPAIDAGANEFVPFETLSDLDGNPRFANCTVDLGAYEFPQAGASPMTGDLNGDCAINAADMALLLACWSGPDVLLLDADCQVRDLDQDAGSDIDLHDYALLQAGS